MEGTGRLARGQGIVGSVGRCSGPLDVQGYNGVEPGVVFLDPSQQVIEQLPARDGPVAKEL